MSFYDRKRQTSIWLRDEDKELLKHLALRHGKSASRFIESLLRREETRRDIDPLLTR